MSTALSFEPPARPASSLRDTLRLIRSENVGPITFYQLLRHYGSAGAALEAIPDLARRGGRAKPITLCTTEKADAEIAATEAFGARLITYAMPEYPARLTHLADAPPVLAVSGHPHLWGEKEAIAIVGARNASANGCQFARRMARELGEAGVLVVSGLARGIDAFAHDGALATGTVGVIAGGIDNVFPVENRGLYERLRAEGAIVAENPIGMAPISRCFPARNRIISGMSFGVVVVEASKKSGSLITGRFALEQGREVFAVPGSPLDPRAGGCNQLLKEGATLTETVDDILSVLRQQTHGMKDSRQPDLFAHAAPMETAEDVLADARKQISRLLGPSPVAVDTLIEMTKLPTGAVMTILLEKELAGVLQRHPGGMVSLVYGS